MNKVVTYSTFSRGKNKANRKEHLKRCGYKLLAELNTVNSKPSLLAKEVEI